MGNGGCICLKNKAEKFDPDQRIYNPNKKERDNKFNSNSSIISIKMSNLITVNNASVEQYYELECLIGTGSFGSIYKVTHKLSNQTRAIKVISKYNIVIQDDKNSDFLNEIKILAEINHPYIVKTYEYFQDDYNFYLILEYLPLGDLEKIFKDFTFANLSEEVIASIFKQLFSAITYLHSNNIIHRDIKLQNILVKSFSATNPDEICIKLTDFGSSNYLFKGESMVYKIGTCFYIAPEILEGKYDFKCDLWACGVLLYFLLVGKMPFDDEEVEEIRNLIKIGNYDTTCNEFKSLSKEAKSLIKSLLTYNYEKRITAEEALNCSWIKKFAIKNSTFKNSTYNSNKNSNKSNIIVNKDSNNNGTDVIKYNTDNIINNNRLNNSTIINHSISIYIHTRRN